MAGAAVRSLCGVRPRTRLVVRVRRARRGRTGAPRRHLEDRRAPAGAALAACHRRRHGGRPPAAASARRPSTTRTGGCWCSAAGTGSRPPTACGRSPRAPPRAGSSSATPRHAARRRRRGALPRRSMTRSGGGCRLRRPGFPVPQRPVGARARRAPGVAAPHDGGAAAGARAAAIRSSPTASTARRGCSAGRRAVPTSATPGGSISPRRRGRRWTAAPPGVRRRGRAPCSCTTRGPTGWCSTAAGSRLPTAIRATLDARGPRRCTRMGARADRQRGAAAPVLRRRHVRQEHAPAARVRRRHRRQCVQGPRSPRPRSAQLERSGAADAADRPRPGRRRPAPRPPVRVRRLRLGHLPRTAGRRHAPRRQLAPPTPRQPCAVAQRHAARVGAQPAASRGGGRDDRYPASQALHDRRARGRRRAGRRVGRRSAAGAGALAAAVLAGLLRTRPTGPVGRSRRLRPRRRPDRPVRRPAHGRNELRRCLGALSDRRRALVAARGRGRDTGPPLGGAAGYAHRQMVVTGGQTGSDGNANSHDDAWALSLDGTPAWRRLTTAGPVPAPRRSPAAAMRTSGGSAQLLVAGGLDAETGEHFNDLWALTLNSDNAGWSQLAESDCSSATAPACRRSASAAYDANRDRLLVLFGRDHDRFYADTWTFGIHDRRWRAASALRRGRPPPATSRSTSRERRHRRVARASSSRARRGPRRTRRRAPGRRRSEQAVEQARREAVAAADAIEDLQAGRCGRLDEPVVARPGDRAPVVDGRGADRAQRRRDDRTVG